MSPIMRMRKLTDGDQSFCSAAARSDPSARFHNLDMARAHLTNFVNLLSALANDASDQVVRDENLLRLRTGR